ncbi:leucine-rich repeat-containing protein 74B-like [Elysia marginata]|uniref:Leucine-rich repeat-containing protein 74B-like n=1 Tax=Elysia marginata TaxID=1093978 RepID=A0AAV4JYK6_9GAST|nr:leucine-rich repeat-containing protein 74B-like [Elysia marginata]
MADVATRRLPPRKPPLSASKNAELVFCHIDRKSGLNQSGTAQQKMKALGVCGKSILRVSTPSPPPEDEDDDLNLVGAESSKPSVDEIKKRLYTRECTKLGVTPVGAFLRAPSRTALCLPHYSLGPMGARALSVPLMLDSTLTTLDLEGNGLGPDGMSNLREVLTDHCAITHLNLKRNKLGYKGALVACQILQTNRLISTLNVSANQIDDKAGVFFANMLKANTQLKRLDLSDNNLAEVAGRQLGGALGQNETLESLDLCWNHFSGNGAVKLLDGVAENVSLKELALAYNCFGKSQGENQSYSLANLLQSNSALLCLDLSSNRLLDRDILMVAKGLADNESLQTLKIGRNLTSVCAASSLLAAVTLNANIKVSLLDMRDLPVSQSDLVKVDQLRARNTQVIHGRVHQTETDFDSKPSTRRPKSGQSEEDENKTRSDSAEDQTQNGTGPIATYVATTVKPGVGGQDEHQQPNQVQELLDDETFE